LSFVSPTSGGVIGLSGISHVIGLSGILGGVIGLSGILGGVIGLSGILGGFIGLSGISGGETGFSVVLFLFVFSLSSPFSFFFI
jgi:hypothetical protein